MHAHHFTYRFHLFVHDPFLERRRRCAAFYIAVEVTIAVCKRGRLAVTPHLRLHLQLEDALAFDVGGY
jgi:hypothetical protein